MLNYKDIFKNILNNSVFQFFFISGLVWLVFVHLHINRHIQDIILGPHYWRKSDTYAQIINYYHNGLNFFDHSIYFNQMNSGGKAVAEFPLFYYLIAIQLKIFGNYALIIKINWIIVLMFGIFSIFKISLHFLKNFLLSVVVSMLLFLSTVFCFYSIDYLPDPIALNFSFIGLWLLIRYFDTNKNITLYVAIFFISFSGMIKPFYLIPYIAFLCTVFFNQFIYKKVKLKLKWIYIMPFLMVFMWFFYVSIYNTSVGSNYFLSETKPIWTCSEEDIVAIWIKLSDFWFADYLNVILFKVFILSIFVNLLWWKKQYVLHNVYFIFSLVGVVFYFLLMYRMLHNHDYYILPMAFIVVLSLGLILLKIKNSFHSTGVNVLAVLLLLLIYFGLDNSFNLLQKRWNVDWRNSKSELVEYYNLEHFLLKNKVQPNDYVITFTDFSPSYGLSIINRKGWSGFQLWRHFLSIDEMIDEGAKFLIYNEKAKGHKDTVLLEKYNDYLVDDTNAIYLYDLQPYKKD